MTSDTYTLHAGHAPLRVSLPHDGSEIPDHQVLAQTLAVGPGWFISIEGGIPVTVEGQCIGAVGVSGAPSAVDRQIGQAGIDAFMKA